MRLATYENLNDCAFSVDITQSFVYNLNDDTFGNFAECDNPEPCDYFQVLCDDSTEVIVTVDECFAGSSTQSYIYSCDGSELTVSLYSTSDCSGNDDTTVIFDYSDIFNDDCHQVK